MRDLLEGKNIRKQIDNKTYNYKMVDTGVYINLRRVVD